MIKIFKIYYQNIRKYYHFFLFYLFQTIANGIRFLSANK